LNAAVQTDIAKGAFMSRTQWNAVERYFVEHFVPPDPALDGAIAASDAAGLPAINVAPTHGKFLQLLARLQGARKILEIGTLGGYSTIWLARALPPEGRLITLELEQRNAELARANIARARIAAPVEVRVGAALDTLPQLEAERAGPFDFFFIDADKRNNPNYFDWAIKLSRPGSVIVVDNVVRDGAVADGASRDPDVLGVRRLFELVAADPRVTATAFQTVSSKGYDGFAIAVVEGQAAV
jgi:predicted O-methyltransferase YrrM